MRAYTDSKSWDKFEAKIFTIGAREFEVELYKRGKKKDGPVSVGSLAAANAVALSYIKGCKSGEFD